MATKSPFDPDQVDSEFYSKDPNQHGTSDYGHESEGVGNNVYHDSTSGIDMDGQNMVDTAQSKIVTKDANNPDAPGGESAGTYQEWDVDPDQLNPKMARPMTESEAKKLESLPDNPSDEALLHRGDATYLEQGDNPNTQYDPHNQGYNNKEGKETDK
ncbi:hypothetical protein J2I47_13315 [Fibrella sp. HMF5335]|uniref:Uncharacterized protein n=1 Tax=Fibrella rubiginis TaxID=2817060 RepID=A0A939GIS3_9BACT|nr:hypothetical protein [Fibrella rubiginis]MBO0937530.1 hypothetical protein [Fibrella rubiginis]